MSEDVLARRDPEAWLIWAMACVENWGLVLDSDARLPSLSSLVVERPVHGSWWADTEVHLINEMGSRVIEHTDVLHTVLVSGKLTCIHRRLWPAFVAVVLAREDWKVKGLSPAAHAIWMRLGRYDRLHADEPGLPTNSAKANGRLMRELEARLLCAGGSVHTARGSHAKFVTTWEAWMRERSLKATGMAAADGRSQLDDCLARLNREFAGRGKLPWWGATPS